MRTRKWTYLSISALLLVAVALSLSAGAAAAPGAAPSAQIPGAAMAPLVEATCTLVDTTRTCELWALAGTLDLPGAAGLPIWGFGTSAAGPALIPGPIIRANLNETLQVVLYNELPGETLSLAFPGQAGLLPDLDGIAAGQTVTYTLNAAAAGTFVYEAGLTAGGSRQVVMGLAGPLIVDSGAVPAWDQEVVLAFGQIDPSFNINPASMNLNDFRAKYWLINGKVYPDTGWIEVAEGTTLLMRYLNLGTDHHTMGLLGLDQSVIALDGQALPFPQGAIAPSVAPGQTLDTLVEVPAGVAPDTLYPLYNASLHQHNNNQRLADTRAAFGGMLTYLKVAAFTPPDNVGPVASSVAVTPQKTDGTADVVLSATLTDADLVAAFEYFIDAAGDPGTGISAVVEPAASPVDVSVTFLAADVATWGSGEHLLYLRGRDALGAWGTLSSAVLNLDMAGPSITGIGLAPNPTNGAVDVGLTGTADDRSNGNSNVVSAEYSIDGGTTWLPLDLNSPGTPLSGLSATIPAADVAALPEGETVVQVRAVDDLGNESLVYGLVVLTVDKTGPDVPVVTLEPNVLDFGAAIPVTTIRLTATVEDPLASGVQSVLKNAEGFLGTQGAPGTGFYLYPSDGLFDKISETAYYDIPASQFASLPSGVYDILVVGLDAAGNWGPAGSASITVTAQVLDVNGPVISNLHILKPNATSIAIRATATDDLSNIAEAVWFIGTDPAATTLRVMRPADGSFDSLVEKLRGRSQITRWPAGTYQISVMARDAAWNWGPIATTTVDIP